MQIWELICDFRRELSKVLEISSLQRKYLSYM